MGLKNNQSFWARGKALGGSGAMNAMLYVRGNRQDYDLHWQQAGGSDWNWESVLSHFEKFEKNLASDLTEESFGSLNVDGYPATEFDEYIKSMLQNLFKDLGFEHLNDLYGDSFIGFGRAKGILNKGTRSSSAKAYLRSSMISNRSNLHVIKLAHVNRLIIDKSSKQVNGVEFVRLPEQKTIIAIARKEVILSAGAVNTPQILMLSGIGPSDEITANKIEPIQMLNGVGKNLQDHIMVPPIFSFHKSSAQSPTYQLLADNFLSYVLQRSGMFSNLGSVDYMGFFNTLNDTLYPDVQIMNYLIPKQSTDTMKLLLSLFNYKQHIIDSIVTSNLQSDTLFAFVVLLNPKSYGKISLKSNNPFDAPKIEPNYLKEIDDVNTLVRAMKIVEKLQATKTFKEHEGEIVQINFDECDRFSKSSDEYWACYVRHMSITVYHPVGTAKMGTGNDENAVVSEKLEVKGVNGLRVVDASMLVMKNHVK